MRYYKLEILASERTMDRRELILAVFSTANREPFSPVQAQKAFFLIDENIADKLAGNKFFNFQPYHYGPFDKSVYEELEYLSRENLIEIDESYGSKNYRLTSKGQEIGTEILSKLEDRERGYIERVVQFVRSLSFTQLVAAIYKAYPDMRKNSVFVS